MHEGLHNRSMGQRTDKSMKGGVSRHAMQNGYSIAEILLVFGIIAGVLVGVWAMYTLLGDNSDVQAAIAEVQMLQSAAVTYKNASGTNNYSTLQPLALTERYHLGTEALLRGERLVRRTEYFRGAGWSIYLEPYPAGEDLVIEYAGIPSIEICKRVLERFGEVTEVSAEEFKIEAGKTISGYVGGEYFDTGCELNTDWRWVYVYHHRLSALDANLIASQIRVKF